MLIIEDFDGHYDDAIERSYNYQRFADGNSDIVFLNGMGCIENKRNYNYKRQYKDATYKTFFNYEQPCCFFGHNNTYIYHSINQDGFFDRIYTACPYTADWLNERHNTNCFNKIYFPFNEEYIVKTPQDKIYDVLYWGHIHSDEHKQIIDIMSYYKYNFFTLGSNFWNIKDMSYCKFITGINIPRQKMWSTIQKTKINIIMNLIPLKSTDVVNAKRHPSWEKNKAFSHLDLKIAPQLKTRAIESAANHCLMLIKKDPWNVIEEWFKPEIDFIYYESKGDLREKIDEIINNWSNYTHITENAFNKVIANYTTKHFIQHMEQKQ